MFYAFVFQDALRFGVINEDAMVNIDEAIKNRECSEFKTLTGCPL